MTFDDRDAAAQAAERERRLEAEHELDDAALRESLPLADPGDGRAGDGVAPVAPTPEPAATAPPPRTGMPRRTRILIGLVLAALVFLAGVQFQKLVGGGGPQSASPATTSTPGAATTATPLPPAVTYGEIVAIRGSTLYVRDADGQTFTVLATPGSRIVRGQPIALREIRPGETIVARASRDPDGRLAATTITVVEPARR